LRTSAKTSELREIIEQEKAKDVICSCRKIEKGADA